MIRDCQDRVFTEYRSRITLSRTTTQTCTRNSDSSLTALAPDLYVEEQSLIRDSTLDNCSENQSTGILEEFYGGPPSSTLPPILPDFLEFEHPPRLCLQKEVSMSGSVTGPSLTDSSASAVSENWTNNFTTNNGSQSNLLTQTSDTSASQQESYQAFFGSIEEAPGTKGSMSEVEFDINFASMFPLDDLYALFPCDGSWYDSKETYVRLVSWQSDEYGPGLQLIHDPVPPRIKDLKRSSFQKGA